MTDPEPTTTDPEPMRTDAMAMTDPEPTMTDPEPMRTDAMAINHPLPESDPIDAREASTGLGGLPVDRETLAALMEPSPLRVVGMTTMLLGLWGMLAWAAWSIPSNVLRIPVYLALGFVVNGLVQLGHDAWHHNLFRKPWQNALYGHLLSLPFGISYEASRHAHLRHHWYNRTRRDPDAYNAGSGWGVWVQYYLVVLAGLPLSPLHFNLLYPLAFYERPALVRHAAQLALYALLYGTLYFALIQPFHLGQAALHLWIYPILCASPWNGLKSIADHYANVWEGDRFHTATTVRTNRLVTFFWNGLNYHLDHHLFPRVPGYRLHTLHGRLKDVLAQREAPVFEGYLRVWWAALRAGPVYVEGHRFLRRQDPG